MAYQSAIHSLLSILSLPSPPILSASQQTHSVFLNRPPASLQMLSDTGRAYQTAIHSILSIPSTLSPPVRALQPLRKPSYCRQRSTRHLGLRRLLPEIQVHQQQCDHKSQYYSGKKVQQPDQDKECRHRQCSIYHCPDNSDSIQFKSHLVTGTIFQRLRLILRATSASYASRSSIMICATPLFIAASATMRATCGTTRGSNGLGMTISA